jgi:hypothetical protein
MTNAPKTPAALADEAAEAIRNLNHATLSRREGWQYPSDAYDVVGDLARLATMLPQALQQAGKFFDDLVESGHVGVDGYGQQRGQTVPLMQAEVTGALVNAISLAQHLYEELQIAHNALGSATYV